MQITLQIGIQNVNLKLDYYKTLSLCDSSPGGERGSSGDAAVRIMAGVAAKCAPIVIGVSSGSSSASSKSSSMGVRTSKGCGISSGFLCNNWIKSILQKKNILTIAVSTF